MNGRNRWLAAFGYGVLAELAVIATIVLAVTAYKLFAHPTGAEYQAFAERVGSLVGPIGGTLFVYIFARLLMRRLSTRFVAHGLVVAVVAIALSIAGSIAGHGSVPSAYILASLLKLAAGALAGFLAARTAQVNA